MKSRFAVFTSVLCIFTCLADVGLLFFLGSLYPGFRQMYDPISALGANGSPVALYMSVWWVILGCNIILFALGFRKVFETGQKHMRISFWLIVLYAIGEGIGSGLFPGNHMNNHLTVTGIFHNIFGGIGVISLSALPFFLLKEFTRAKHQNFFYISWIVGITGILFFLLFSVSRFTRPYTGLLSLHGLWQRLYLVDYYIYFILLALLVMYKKPGSQD